MHNVAFWAPKGVAAVGMATANPAVGGFGVALDLVVSNSAKDLNIGSSIEAESRWYVRWPSKVFKLGTKIGTLDFLNW